MSNKDPKTNKNIKNKNINTINDDIKDRRDTELTFLKKISEEYELRPTQNGNEQGEKRIRTASDEEYDKTINEYGTPKRSRSSQRKTRTITNSYYAATTTSNYNNFSSRIDKMDNQLNNSQKKTSVKTGDFNFKITRNAITYAVEQNLPAIRLECEPKLNEHKEGAALIKELIKLIEDDFKKINPKIKTNSDIGFDTWFIDNKGDLLCYTNNINLFVFLCDVQHVPNKIINTNVKVILPKHLPPQRSIIIKGVPNSLCIEDINDILAQKFTTIYIIEEILGTNNGKSRYVRMDLLSEIEYQQILRSGIICMEGQCLHVIEYLAAPRVLFCSKCNEPGHSKKNCSFDFERCRRCGGDRNVGQHNECGIRCHNCKEEHLSTDYKCVAVQCYRRDLIQHIQQHPESLPNDIQLFIPSQYRRQGDKTISNRNFGTRQTLDNQQLKNKINPEEWPILPPPTRSTISFTKYADTCPSDIMNNVKLQLSQIEINCALAKEEYDRKNIEIKSQISSSINQIQSLITCCSSVIQKQNEAIAVLKNAICECLEFNRVTNQALCCIMDKSGDQQYVEISKQLSSIPFAERQSSINKLFSTYTPILDEFTMKLLEVTKHLYLNVNNGL
ncbi:unnamed protein product [Rotaria sordida]|uniref:CCHC-type domain-containing protein n=1 Tax=Rotaria sordida TaxID=392033 RepID=A0A815JQS4_9BILA|nr:unnamed protein product [Rotaria sordida]